MTVHCLEQQGDQRNCQTVYHQYSSPIVRYCIIRLLTFYSFIKKEDKTTFTKMELTHQAGSVDRDRHTETLFLLPVTM